MNNRHSSTRMLPTLLLGAIAAALVLASTAVAEPIVTVPPLDVAGTQVSGSASNDPQADVCVGDQHSGADPATTSVLQLNDSTCTSASGASSGSASGSQGTAGRTGSMGASGTGGSAGSAGSAGKRAASASVAAGDAVGLRIVKVRKVIKNVNLRRNFRMLVTLRDTRGFLVRGAIVSVGKVPGSRRTVAGLHAGFSNKRGVANILVPVTKRMFGARLFVKIAARTPKARAVALRSVSLPALR